MLIDRGRAEAALSRSAELAHRYRELRASLPQVLKLSRVLLKIQDPKGLTVAARSAELSRSFELQAVWALSQPGAERQRRRRLRRERAREALRLRRDARQRLLFHPVLVVRYWNTISNAHRWAAYGSIVRHAGEAAAGRKRRSAVAPQPLARRFSERAHEVGCHSSDWLRVMPPLSHVLA